MIVRDNRPGYPPDRTVRAAGAPVPLLPKQPGYHKRVKAAAPLICQATLYLATLGPSWADDLRLLDGTPALCGTSRQTVRYSDLAGLANYGY
jgi:hypothetical protein